MAYIRLFALVAQLKPSNDSFHLRFCLTLAGNTKGVNFTPAPSVFPNKLIPKVSICDLLRVGLMLRVDPTRSYGKNTKSPIQDSHRFCYKNHFFQIISHNHLLFSHILVWFYNIFMILNWTARKNWRLFTFPVITWLNFDLEQNIFHRNISQDPSKSVLQT